MTLNDIMAHLMNVFTIFMFDLFNNLQMHSPVVSTVTDLACLDIRNQWKGNWKSVQVVNSS